MDFLLDLLGKHNQRLMIASLLVVLVLITLSIGSTVLSVLNQLTMKSEAMPAPAGSAQPGRRVSLSGLSQLNLFGTIETEPTAARISAPETRLNLELQGIFTSPDQLESKAIIGEKNKPGELYEPGDRLPGRVTLFEVHEDHVIIRRGSQLERLSFGDALLQQTPAPALREPAFSGGAPPMEDAQIQHPEPDEAMASLAQPSASRVTDAGARPRSIGEYIKLNRDRIKREPDVLLKELGVQTIAAGQAAGYKVTGEVPDELLRRAGLRQGDVIVSVNGQAVGNALNDSNLIDSAVAAGRVRVEVQRENRRFFVTVPVK